MNHNISLYDGISLILHHLIDFVGFLVGEAVEKDCWGLQSSLCKLRNWDTYLSTKANHPIYSVYSPKILTEKNM